MRSSIQLVYLGVRFIYRTGDKFIPYTRVLMNKAASLIFVLPDLALAIGVHGRPAGALEVPREFHHIRERASDSEHVGRVDAGQHAQL